MLDIKKTLESFDGELYDLCFELIEGRSNTADIFEYACKNLLTMPETKEIRIKKYFSAEEITEYKTLYGDSVDGIINSTIKRCDYGLAKPDEFYQILWKSFSSIFFSSKELAFAFYYTLIDMRIPYQYLGKPVSMENERFGELTNANRDSLKKLEYIRMSGYKQRTETASLLLHCLDSIADFDSKVVVLAHALSILATKSNTQKTDIDELIRQIDKKIAELEKEESEQKKA